MIKGALVEYVAGFGAAVPNVVIFQFNPETMRHTLTQPAPAPTPGQAGGNPQAVAGNPGETFSFSLALDITDKLSDPDEQIRHEGADLGLYPRLAALEMLLFPSPVLAVPTQKRTTPTAQVPTVLFVWGTKRIVPVRVTSLTITEKLYDENLNPTHADAQIELRVLTPDELEAVADTTGRMAYGYSQGVRAGLVASQAGADARAAIGFIAYANAHPGGR